MKQEGPGGRGDNGISHQILKRYIIHVEFYVQVSCLSNTPSLSFPQAEPPTSRRRTDPNAPPPAPPAPVVPAEEEEQQPVVENAPVCI